MQRSNDLGSIAPKWLDWGRELAALAQTGLHYTTNEFDRQRFSRLAEIATEILEAHCNLSGEQVEHLFFEQKGYATPKVDVRAAVFRDEKLLMVREKMDGRWTLPGGWADVGDIPSKAAERETWEEAGFHVRARKVIGVYDANRTGPLELYHAFKIIFLCDLEGGEATTSNETSEVRFFGEDEIPQELSGERTRPYQIRDAFTAWKDLNCPTIFD